MINVLYEDNSLVVCIKPAGYLSEYSKDSPVSLPLALCEQLSLHEIFTVHRLDKEVSGIMVYAKTAKSAAALSAQIGDGRFKKEYVAIISGRLPAPSALLSDLLFHDKQKNKTYVVKKKRAGVKEALLEYEELSYDKEQDRSTLNIKLLTGRTHQIRVQLASRACPICGDKKYGSSINIKPMRLHSSSLSFYALTNNKPLSFSSAPEWKK